jgi:hypothetical protein
MSSGAKIAALAAPYLHTKNADPRGHPGIGAHSMSFDFPTTRIEAICQAAPRPVCAGTPAVSGFRTGFEADHDGQSDRQGGTAVLDIQRDVHDLAGAGLGGRRCDRPGGDLRADRGDLGADRRVGKCLGRHRRPLRHADASQVAQFDLGAHTQRVVRGHPQQRLGHREAEEAALVGRHFGHDAINRRADRTLIHTAEAALRYARAKSRAKAEAPAVATV